MERLCADLTVICETHIDMFRELPEMDAYLVMAVGNGYGGLEHRASTSLVCKRDDLPQVGDTEISQDIEHFSVCAARVFSHMERQTH